MLYSKFCYDSVFGKQNRYYCKNLKKKKHAGCFGPIMGICLFFGHFHRHNNQNYYYFHHRNHHFHYQNRFELDSLQENSTMLHYIPIIHNIGQAISNHKWFPKKDRASFSAKIFRPWSGCRHVGQLLICSDDDDDDDHDDDDDNDYDPEDYLNHNDNDIILLIMGMGINKLQKLEDDALVQQMLISAKYAKVGKMRKSVQKCATLCKMCKVLQKCAKYANIAKLENMCTNCAKCAKLCQMCI